MLPMLPMLPRKQRELIGYVERLAQTSVYGGLARFADGVRYLPRRVPRRRPRDASPMRLKPLLSHDLPEDMAEKQSVVPALPRPNRSRRSHIPKRALINCN